MKIILVKTLSLVAMMSLMLMQSGCCTGSLIHPVERKTTDKFHPTAYYKLKTEKFYALEGIRDNSTSETNTHCFLIVPQSKFSNDTTQINQIEMVAQIRNLPSSVTTQCMVKKKLTFDCDKIVELPENDISLVVEEHHRDRGLYVFSPITVALDVVTAPFQIVIFYLLSKGMSGWQG